MTKVFLPLMVLLICCSSAFSQNDARFRDIAPGMKNKQLERQAVKLANKRAEAYCWREEYYKAVIISHEWELDLDKNGFLKGRKIHMELLARLPGGRCAMTDFTFRQKVLQDETFSDKLLYDRVSDLVYVDCD